MKSAVCRSANHAGMTAFWSVLLIRVFFLRRMTGLPDALMSLLWLLFAGMTVLHLFRALRVSRKEELPGERLPVPPTERKARSRLLWLEGLRIGAAAVIEAGLERETLSAALWGVFFTLLHAVIVGRLIRFAVRRVRLWQPREKRRTARLQLILWYIAVPFWLATLNSWFRFTDLDIRDADRITAEIMILLFLVITSVRISLRNPHNRVFTKHPDKPAPDDNPDINSGTPEQDSDNDGGPPGPEDPHADPVGYPA